MFSSRHTLINIPDERIPDSQWHNAGDNGGE